MNPFRLVAGGFNEVGFSGLNWTSFLLDANSLVAGLFPSHVIVLHSVQEILTAFGVVNVLDPDINSLGDDSSPATQ